MGTVHIPAVATENIKNGAARKTDLAGDSSKNIQMQETEKAFNDIGVSILDRVTFKKVSRPKRAYKKRYNGHTALDRASATNLGVGIVFDTAGAGESSDQGSESGNSEDGDFGEHGDNERSQESVVWFSSL